LGRRTDFKDTWSPSCSASLAMICSAPPPTATSHQPPATTREMRGRRRVEQRSRGAYGGGQVAHAGRGFEVKGAAMCDRGSIGISR
jgi:hypothetical protein